MTCVSSNRKPAPMLKKKSDGTRVRASGICQYSHAPSNKTSIPTERKYPESSFPC